MKLKSLILGISLACLSSCGKNEGKTPPVVTEQDLSSKIQAHDNPLNDKDAKDNISGDDKSTADSGVFSELFASFDNLPACDSNREGQLIYILEDELFLTCSSEQWVEVDLGGGSNNYAGYSVTDANGQSLGFTNWNGKFESASKSINIFIESEGITQSVSKLTGRILSQTCYYKSNDCSGTCYQQRDDFSGPPSAIDGYFDNNSTAYKLSKDSPIETFIYGSTIAYDGTTCSLNEYPQQPQYFQPTNELQWKELSYPFAVPFAVD